MSKFVELGIKAAHAAGKIIMEYFGDGKDKQIKEKGFLDLVTKADIEAEKKILDILRKEHPTHSFVMEESDNIYGDNYTWIVDPLDGTFNFAHNYPFFSVSIALHKNSIPMMGVVFVPYFKELFVAEKGKGSTLNGKKIKVSNIETVQNSIISTGFPVARVSGEGETNLDYFLHVASKAGGLRRMGSAALDLCYVASGRQDVYWEQGLKIVDTAAGEIIVKEAGGTITDMKGKPTNSGFQEIVASNSLVHNEFIKILSEVKK